MQLAPVTHRAKLKTGLAAPQEADEEQLRTADDAAAAVAARLGQLASERAALEEHRDATAAELQSAKASLEARRSELSRLQGEARSSKCAPVRCDANESSIACMQGLGLGLGHVMVCCRSASLRGFDAPALLAPE